MRLESLKKSQQKEQLQSCIASLPSFPAFSFNQTDKHAPIANFPLSLLAKIVLLWKGLTAPLQPYILRYYEGLSPVFPEMGLGVSA